MARTGRAKTARYLGGVRPMCEKFVGPSARFADVVLDARGAVDLTPMARRVREIMAEGNCDGVC